jgi:hypothetical protein
MGICLFDFDPVLKKIYIFGVMLLDLTAVLICLCLWCCNFGRDSYFHLSCGIREGQQSEL